LWPRTRRRPTTRAGWCSSTPSRSHPGGDDAFLAAWEASRAFLATQPGYLGTRLHRSLSPEADFRFVNIGRYTSPQAFQTAIGQPQFRLAAAAIQHRAHPGLYEVVRR
jgi:heme oxygenase (mycobilin-producing)